MSLDDPFYGKPFWKEGSILCPKSFVLDNKGIILIWYNMINSGNSKAYLRAWKISCDILKGNFLQKNSPQDIGGLKSKLLILKIYEWKFIMIYVNQDKFLHMYFSKIMQTFYGLLFTRSNSEWLHSLFLFFLWLIYSLWLMARHFYYITIDLTVKLNDKETVNRSWFWPS